MIFEYIAKLLNATDVLFELEQFFAYINNIFSTFVFADYLIFLASFILCSVIFYLSRLVFGIVEKKSIYHRFFTMFALYIFLQLIEYLINRFLQAKYVAHSIELLFPYFAIYSLAHFLFAKYKPYLSKAVVRILKFDFYALFNWSFLAISLNYFLPDSQIIKAGFVRFFVLGLFLIFLICLFLVRKIVLESIRNKDNAVLRRVLKIFYSSNWFFIFLFLFMWLSQDVILVKMEKFLISTIILLASYFLKWGVKKFLNKLIENVSYENEIKRLNKFVKFILNIIVDPLMVILIFSIWSIDIVKFVLEITGTRLVRKAIYFFILFVVFRVLFIFSLVFIRLYMRDRIKNRRVEKRVQTLMSILNVLFKIVLLTVFLFFALLILGVNPSPLFANFWILTAGLSIGLQPLLKDFAIGVIMMFEDTFHVGDEVEVSNISGKIEEVTLRVVRIRDAEGALVSIPFNKVEIIANKSRKYIYIIFPIYVAVDANLEKVLKLMQLAGEKLKEIPELEGKILEDIQVLGAINISANGILCEGKIKLHPNIRPKFIKASYYQICKKLFDENDIKITQGLNNFKQLFL